MQLATNVFLKPAWNLHTPDIFFDGVMRAGFGHQHPVAGLQQVYGDGCPGLRNEIAFQP